MTRFLNKKSFILVLLLILTMTFIGCKPKVNVENVEISVSSDKYELKEGDNAQLSVEVRGTENKAFQYIYNQQLIKIENNVVSVIQKVTQVTSVDIIVVADADKTKTATVTINITPVKIPEPKKDIKIAIKGTSEVRTGKFITLSANVTGATNEEVTWEVTEGKDFALIDSTGKLTANDVSSDKIIKVVARSVEDNSVCAEKIITVVAKPVLTQEMLNAIAVEKVGFEGYINIDVYTIGLFPKLYQTYTTTIKTSMDGINWYAEYENANTMTNMGLYYKNHNNLASSVSVSFMNDEEYIPMLDDKGNEVSWAEGGLYNSLTNLKVSDFTFDQDTWRYMYSGNDKNLAKRVVASANPYDFIVDNFGLIIGDGEILGIYAKSKDDPNVVVGYNSIQELIVSINNQPETVIVPKIAKYSYDEAIHKDLGIAIDNMRSLTSYTLDYKETTGSYLSTGYVQQGFVETVTPDICHFVPYSVSYDSRNNEIHKENNEDSYGFKKINENLYNAYRQTGEDSYVATRAYATSLENAMPSFAFAPEIFREYYIDEKAGTTTYYVDAIMSSVSSTFYYGMGNDINLYGIFATEMQGSEGFKPYVVVKDQHIVEASFYFYLGSVYGIVDLKYSDFDEAALPIDLEINFETRNVPTSWSELTIEVSEDSGSTLDDKTVNALEFLKEFYGDEDIDNNLPFFGDVLGDTYGFGLTTIHTPVGTNLVKKAVVFYYDVPLGLDYTIDKPLKDIKDFLISKGFEENQKGEFNKDGIWISPVDASLDLTIYIWK